MQVGSVFDISSVDIRDGLISFQVSGKDAYDKFRQESGGHRWQRIPPTESKGRYHTSTITVVVLKGGTISEITIRNEDLEWKFCRGRGKGGQHRNKRDTAVWLKHKPSGVHIRSEEERSQSMNKAKALSKLKDKLEYSQRNLSDSKDTKERREQAGSGQAGSGQRSSYTRTIKERKNKVTNCLNGRSVSFKKYKKGILSPLFETIL